MNKDDQELTYHQRWYQENKERVLAKQKEYYANNSEKILARSRKTYHENKEEISLYRKEIRDSNPERFHQYSNDYYKNNTEKVLVRTKKYHEENKENYRIWNMSWREIPKNRIKESVMKAKNTGHKRGHIFEERLFELVENPPTHCKCCFKGLDYSVGKGGKRHSMSPTLDRLDNTRGYTFENTFIICRRCNTIKSDATFEDITNFYNYMQANRPKPCSNIDLETKAGAMLEALTGPFEDITDQIL